MRKLRWVIIFLAMVVFLFGCLTERQIQKCRQSSVIVDVNNTSGTGIVIAPNRVLTVAHALNGEISILGKPVKMIKVDEGNDLMLIETEHTFKHWPRVADELPKLGDEVIIIGHAWCGFDREMVQHLTFGKISKKENSIIWIDGKMVPGFSGSPVINEMGEVVAIIQAFYGYNLPSAFPPIPGPLIYLFAIGKNSLVIKEFLDIS